jgi:hypothetical protein
MRVLLASSDLHLPAVRGGLQATTHDLCRAIQGAGAEVAVLCGLDLPGAAAEGPDIRSDESFGYLTMRARSPQAALPGFATEWNATAIVVQSSAQLAPLLAAALATGRPTAAYLHNVEVAALGGVLRPDPSVLYLANSSFTARRWHALHGLGCAVIPPVVDAPSHLAEGGPRDRVLFVNPTPVKGVERMFALAQACPELPFLVVESWPLSPSWEHLCRSRGAALPNLRWMPATADMRPVYGHARVLLMPSVWEEAFGRMVVEAQINGIPALASRRGALPELVGDGGIVLDADGPLEPWIDALRTLHADAAGFGAAARRLGLGHAASGPLIAGQLLGLLAVHAAR